MKGLQNRVTLPSASVRRTLQYLENSQSSKDSGGFLYIPDGACHILQYNRHRG